MSPSQSEFVQKYGRVYESSAWVAEEIEAELDGETDIDRIAEVMAACVDNASRERQLALIRAHPDLAGKAQIAGELTEDSTTEQASAGLDRCTPEEYLRFQDMNQAYHLRFGFPFVMAVRGSSRPEILAAFEERLGNDRDVEFETALAEIHKIARLRLQAMEAGE